MPRFDAGNKADGRFQFYDFYHLNKGSEHTDQPDCQCSECKIKRGEPASGGDNSPWSTIGGLIKYFRFSWEEVMWELSWTNINMLMATIPQYKPAPKQKEPDDDDEIEAEMAEDLKNFLKM